MATVKVFLKIDDGKIVECLRNAREKIGDGYGEPVLDFSSVRRIDPAALRAMEELAAASEDQTVIVGVRGVNVSIYKVLKLANLTQRFSFLN
jgi:anti-anti-sigma regulatory factor